jgi:hypothetical protein
MSVYFIRNKLTGNVKIGFTKGDPEKRRQALQTACDGELELVAFVDGFESEERELHVRYRSLRVRGEWFRAEGALAEHMRSLAPKVDIGQGLDAWSGYEPRRLMGALADAVEEVEVDPMWVDHFEEERSRSIRLAQENELLDDAIAKEVALLHSIGYSYDAAEAVADKCRQRVAHPRWRPAALRWADSSWAPFWGGLPVWWFDGPAALDAFLKAGEAMLPPWASDEADEVWTAWRTSIYRTGPE